MLAKSLIDNELQSTKTRTTCYFFFKDDSREQKSVTNAVCALLHQLLDRKQGLMGRSVESFRRNGSGYFHSFQNSWALLVEAAQDASADEVVCILDALDECEDGGRLTLIESLNTLFSAKEIPGSKFKFLVTSRPYYDIEQRFDELTVRLTGEDETGLIQQEIDFVIRDRIPRIKSRLQLDTETESTLEKRLLATEHRMYLWLHLILEEIERSLGVHTSRRMAKFLDTMPSTVYEAYEKILDRSSNPEKARKLLQMVVVAVHPLTLREMNMALNIEPGQKSRDDVDLDPEERMRSYITNLCGLLVCVYHSKIYLLHQTARKFLLFPESSEQSTSIAEPSVRGWKHSISPSVSHSVLARICLIYLSFDVFEDEPLALVDEDVEGESDIYSTWRVESRKQIITDHYRAKHDLLAYAAGFWGLHFREAEDQNSLVTLWKKVCDVKSQRLLTWMNIYNRIDNNAEIGPNTVLIASSYGHDSILKGLIDAKFTLDCITVSKRRTPLHCAIMEGHITTVKLLLESGAQTEWKNEKGQTPLFVAVSYENEEMVRLLLKAGAQTECRSNKGKKPLMLAARQGYCTIVELLLEVGAEKEFKDSEGITPLIQATQYSEVAVVKLLIEKGAVVDSRCHKGRTPLSWAAEGGLAPVARALVEAGASPNIKDYTGRTPLDLARRRLRRSIDRARLATAADVIRLLEPITVVTSESHPSEPSNQIDSSPFPR